MTSNFLIFDENQLNLPSDNDYSLSDIRTDGNVGGEPADVDIYNKLFFQSSTMAAALGAVMSTLGETIDDTQYSDLQNSLMRIFATWPKGNAIASSGTLTIPATGGYFHVTGTTTITALNRTTARAGVPVVLVFDGSLVLTHNATSLILPEKTNITTSPGNVAVFACEDADNNYWRCIGYSPSNAYPTYFGSGADGALTTSGNVTITTSADGAYAVKNYTNLTVSAGDTITTSNRCKGLVIYCTGDLVVNGSISMSSKGASAAGASINIKRYGTGQIGDSTIITEEANFTGTALNTYNIPSAGSAGGASNTAGTAGTAGGTGGGGGGGQSGGGQAGGAGAAGTSYSGGSAGGGAAATNVGGAATANGGAGGAGAAGSSSRNGGGGAGNNGGAAGGTGATAGANGTGGLIIIIVRGDVTIGAAGSIVAAGGIGGHGNTGASENGGGGGSGGGSILICYGGAYTNGGSVAASGGAGGAGTAPGTTGGAGGAGSIQTKSVVGG